MAHQEVTIEREGRIGILTFNRPRVLNAFNQTLMECTREAMEELRKDPAVLAIVVRGAGRSFSAGFDMKESAARAIKVMPGMP